MRARWSMSFLLLGLPVLACSPSGTTPGEDTGATPGTDGGGGETDGGGGGLDVGGATESFSVTFPAVSVPVGEENTQCVVMRLGNPNAIHVGTIHNLLSEGSHHFIVYRTNDTTEQRTPFECTPFVDTLDPEAGSPLMITQRQEETLVLPDGVAFDLDADQMIRLEMHYINTGTATLDVEATATFTTIPDALYEHAADFIFIGNPDIDIAPHASATVGPTFFPLPEEYEGVNFFAVTGHTHQFGTNVTISTATAETGGSDTSIYDIPEWSWHEPETARMDPPITIPTGGGFRFTCEYENTSGENVGFGESAGDEMCFFWAYYYPSRGARVCVHTDQTGGGVNLCCPGSPLCSILSSSF
jgi:hypothetical protein